MTRCRRLDEETSSYEELFLCYSQVQNSTAISKTIELGATSLSNQGEGIHVTMSSQMMDGPELTGWFPGKC